MGKTIILVALAIISTSGHAANACKILSKRQAMKAFDLVHSQDIYQFTVIDKYCEACLDDYPQPVLVNNYRVKKNRKGHSLYVNGRAIDLTYFYAGGINMAQAVGCKTIAVSKFIE